METKDTPNTQAQRWQNKIEALLACKILPPDNFKNFDDEDRAGLTRAMQQRIEKLNSEHSRLLEIMGEVAQFPANRLCWENNHLKITKAIQTTLAKSSQMPSPTYIAEITGLSRQTVTKHLAGAEQTSVYAEHLRSFSIMAPHVLNKVLQGAIGSYSNIPAIKLYFELLEKMQGKTQSAQLNLQNNYIQINNTILKQETLQQLSPEQLKQIEEIVMKYVPAADAEKVEDI